MTNTTQDTVSSIAGAIELIQKCNILFAKKHTSFIFISEGFQIHVNELPYFFQVNYDENFNWVVFLTSVKGGFDDDEETYAFYDKLEEIIHHINLKYFNEDNDCPILNEYHAN